MATRLRCDANGGPAGEAVELTLSEQGAVHARTVVVASGARYRRPVIANLEQFEGDCVHYWASPVEAKLCGGEEIALVGAGNSAGQAAVFLAPQVKRLTMLVRGEGLEASMSRYLIDRIRMLDNVEIRVHSELTELQGARAEAWRAPRCATGSPARHPPSRPARCSCSSVPSPTRSGWRAVWRSTTAATCSPGGRARGVPAGAARAIADQPPARVRDR